MKKKEDIIDSLSKLQPTPQFDIFAYFVIWLLPATAFFFINQNAKFYLPTALGVSAVHLYSVSKLFLKTLHYNSQRPPISETNTRSLSIASSLKRIHHSIRACWYIALLFSILVLISLFAHYRLPEQETIAVAQGVANKSVGLLGDSNLYIFSTVLFLLSIYILRVITSFYITAIVSRELVLIRTGYIPSDDEL